MAISINFTKTVDNAVDLSQKKTYINGAFTSASDIANFPTVGIATGSELVNVGGGNDTGKKYVFTGTAWNLAPSGGGGGSAKIINLAGYRDGDVIIITSPYQMWDEITSTFDSCGYIVLDCTSLTVVLKSDYSTPNGHYRFSSTSITDTNATYKCSLEFWLNGITVEYRGDMYDASPLIVTLTPTSQDFSGTMDKTVAEIYEAYQSGRKIVFRVMMSETNHMDVDCTARWFDDAPYPSFNGFILDNDTHMLVFAATGSTNDGTSATYGTELYPLTPLS